MKKARFRVLVVAGLSNSMLDCFLSQIVRNEEVSLDILRSKTGSEHERVTYICPPSPLQKNPVLSFLWKVLYSLYLGLKTRYTCIYAIFAYPHLYIAFLIAFLSRKPLFYSIIASSYELIGRNSVLRKLTIKIARKARKVMVSGERVIEYLIEEGVQRRNIIRYSIIELANLDGFAPLGLDKIFDLIVLSRLAPDKNIETFIDIVASLTDSNPGIKAGIIGDGKLRENLERYTKSLQLSENIKFYGYIHSAHDVNCILNLAKIFVLNSSHEGGPFTIPEAMAAGLCVVSSDVGEVRHIVKNGYNGFIVSRYDDIDGYVRIITQLLEDPKKLEEIQQRAAKIKEREANIVLRRFWKRTVEHLRPS